MPQPTANEQKISKNKLSNSDPSVKRRPWGPKRRLKQAEIARKAKPWRHSTGPKTQQGIISSRYNAWKTGQYTHARREFWAHHRNLRKFIVAALMMLPHLPETKADALLAAIYAIIWREYFPHEMAKNELGNAKSEGKRAACISVAVSLQAPVNAVNLSP